MRFVVLDTETTGLNRKRRNGISVCDGHRVIEIGCVEIVDGSVVDGFHSYIRADSVVDPAATRVHGITDDFLMGKPSFHDVVGDFLSYIDGAVLIIHNAAFDIAFLNQEFSMLPMHKQPDRMFEFIDTLLLSRRLFPGQRNDLDSLCNRFGIKGRSGVHGALLDAQLLALVYIELSKLNF